MVASRGDGRRRTRAELRGDDRADGEENPTWSRGALYNVGHEVARSTIQRVLVEAGPLPNGRGVAVGRRS